MLSLEFEQAARPVVLAAFGRGLRGGHALDLAELGFVEAFGFPEVELALGVEPELGAVAEIAGEAEGHGRAYGALLVDELVDRLAGHFDGRGEVGD